MLRSRSPLLPNPTSLFSRASLFFIWVALTLSSSWAAALPECLSEKFHSLAADSSTPIVHSASSSWTSLPTAKDNRHFIQLAAQGENIRKDARPLRFYEVENAALKALNDQVFKSKDLVDQSEAMWRDILLSELRSEPLLFASLQAQYQDFKSLRFALDSSPEVEEAFSRAFQRSQLRFEEDLLKSPLGSVLQHAPSHLKNPTQWHMAAVGNSVDEAGLSARYARSLSSTKGVPLQSIESAGPWLTTQALQAETFRRTWINSLNPEAQTLLLSRSDGPGSPLVPISAVFEVVRKVDFSKPEIGIRDLGSKIQNRFGITLSPTQLRQLQGYTQAIDAFSVGILIPERVVNDLSPAKNGILSADFAGQGGRNLEETASSLAVTSSAALKGDIRKVISEARLAEVRATQRMRALNDEYREALEKTVGKDAIKRITFSGDDGIYLPENDWSRSQREQLVKNLTETAEIPSQFRMTFVPTRFSNGVSIPNSIRSRLIYQAEMLEKGLRSKLEGKLTRAELVQSTFFVEFIPNEFRPLEGGTYHVIMGTKSRPQMPRGPPSKETEEVVLKALSEVLPSVSGGPASTAKIGQFIQVSSGN